MVGDDARNMLIRSGDIYPEETATAIGGGRAWHGGQRVPASLFRAATMLQQILRDMYIDPELLAELGEDQKQTLFCRMREEQVRRWRIWDKEQEKLAEQQGPKPERKTKVTFLEGIDGNPWTWVMGEHPDDKTIEQILEEEAREKARKIAEKETQKLRSVSHVEIFPSGNRPEPRPIFLPGRAWRRN